ncbi:hypothetical protein N7478_010549 [Penicillium angulare]|uniref:uncharacterized protein n=1 Tax=Penicillium angulare TaxID=116970 RepID=UPI00254052B9|nr:uncharacterized protein N7478_010549 [Penicillium angulare]KAJ5267741.1 hypothetical protein N7478_010549 [Penicillium angulare]
MAWEATSGSLPQGLFIAQFLYVGTVCFAKFSILAMYWRLFKIEHYVRVAIYVLAVMVACWGLGVIITSCLLCIPLKGYWNKTIKAKCGVDSRIYFIGNAIPNIVTDAAILYVPIHVVWGLNLRMLQKIILSFVFLMGAFATATSIIRLIYLMSLDLTSGDVTWTTRKIQIWTPVEMDMVIISALLLSDPHAYYSTYDQAACLASIMYQSSTTQALAIARKPY